MMSDYIKEEHFETKALITGFWTTVLMPVAWQDDSHGVGFVFSESEMPLFR